MIFKVLLQHCLWLNFILACVTSSAEDSWVGKTIYNKVNLRTELKGRSQVMYSTNHYGLPNMFKINTAFKVLEIGGKRIAFQAEKTKETVEIRYNFKHTPMSIDDYLKKNFSLEPVSLPPGLTKKERENIEKGMFEEGMSRKALFLAIGYPPHSLTPSEMASSIMYEKKRFNRTRFYFDQNDILIKIKE